MEYKFDVSGRFKRGLRVSYRHAVSGFVLIVTWARVMTQKKDGFVSRSDTIFAHSRACARGPPKILSARRQKPPRVSTTTYNHDYWLVML